MYRINHILTLLRNVLDLILIPIWILIGLTILFGYFMPDRIVVAMMCFILAADTWIIYMLFNERNKIKYKEKDI
jgi:hypothetical protein